MDSVIRNRNPSMIENFEIMCSLYCKAFVFAVYGYIAPVVPVLMSLFILIGIDTFLGIWASIKIKRPLISGRAWRIAVKLAVATTTILGMLAFEKISAGYIPAVTLVATTLAIVEVVSILENAGLILGQPLFKYIIKKLDSKNIETTKGEKDGKSL